MSSPGAPSFPLRTSAPHRHPTSPNRLALPTSPPPPRAFFPSRPSRHALPRSSAHSASLPPRPTAAFRAALFPPRPSSSSSNERELLGRTIYQQLFCLKPSGSSMVTSSSLNSEHRKLTGSEECFMEPPEQIINGEVDDKKVNTEASTRHQMVRVCDKLIEVFMVDKPQTSDWRRLLAFSKEWVNIRAYFYKRCQERAEAAIEPEMKHALLRLGRKIKEVDEDVQRHNELLDAVKEALPDITELVVRRRKDFTIEFFEHLHAVAESYHDSPAEQKTLVELRAKCLAAMQAYDSASESIEALNAAELKFEDLINSPTLNDACKKIDDLAEKKQLDSALMLMLTKAWSAAKDSNMAKDEVKDILYHLYMTARKNLESQVPKETRILHHLLMIEDPEELMSDLKDAFTPGTDEQDDNSIYTTPEELFTWIQTVVDAYHFSRQGTLLREAKDFMNPQVILRLEELKKLIKDKFM